MIRRLYEWTMELAASPHAERMLAVVAFVESSVFPIPPDVMLIPMVLAERARWIRYALICTAASIAGALLGYGIGMFLYEQVAVPLLEFYGYLDKFDQFRAIFAEWGWWFVIIAGLTPFPYKVITIASGAAGLSLPVFIVASILSRGLRFFIVSGLLFYFGEPIRDFIEKRLGLLFTLFVVLLLGGFAAVRFLF
ncbi:MAG: YqaA family protein [Oricola sp.]